MTGGTIGAETTSTYGCRAVDMWKDTGASTVGTFNLQGGTLRTYSNSTYYGKTIKLTQGTFNYKSGTITAGGSNSNRKQLSWQPSLATFNNTSGTTLSLVETY